MLYCVSLYIYIYIYIYTNDTCITNYLYCTCITQHDISQILKGPCLSIPKSVILLYLNVNSIRSKFDNFQEIISNILVS